MIRRFFTSIAVAALPAVSSAQCPSWSTEFGSGGASDTVTDLAVSEVGGSLALYAAGEFFTVGNAVAAGVARWNGTSWSGLGGGLAIAGSVRRITPLDYGTGPVLVALGEIVSAQGQPARQIAVWNGSLWDTLGGGPPSNPAVEILTLNAAAAYDSGAGPILYVGGQLTAVPWTGASQPVLLTWDGIAWTRIPAGPAAPPCPVPVHPACFPPGSIEALAVYNDGSGRKLYVGGQFTTVNGAANFNLARFDGTAWSTVGSVGAPDELSKIKELVVHNDGSGNALYIQGAYIGVQRWNGTTLSSVGTPPTLQGADLVSLPATATSGAGLWYAAPSELSNANLSLHRWDGASWTTTTATLDKSSLALALAAFDSGAGPQLYLGGKFQHVAGTTAPNIARLDTGGWNALGSGQGFGSYYVDSSVFALALHDDGAGKRLYLGGNFLWIGGRVVQSIARWNGTLFEALPDPIDVAIYSQANTLESLATGPFPGLYGSGNLKVHSVTTRWMKWDGLQVSTQAVPAVLEVLDIAAYDAGSGSEMYAINFNGLWKKGAVGGWTPVAVDTGSLYFTSIETFDDGSGPALYVGGRFSVIGSLPVSGIARYKSGVFSTVGGGIDAPFSGTNAVRELRVLDDGARRRLFVGGTFSLAGALPAGNIAAWDGLSWDTLGGGVAGGADVKVVAMEMFDDGSGGGRALYAGGLFSSAGGSPAANLARFGGSLWTGAGLEITGSRPDVAALVATDTASAGGHALHVCGSFDAVAGLPSQHYARLGACPAGIALCAGDGSGTTCPCSNAGLPGRGCDNTAASGGAVLSTDGSARIGADTLVLIGNDAVPFGPGLYFQGSASSAPGTSFGNGLLCVAGSTPRLEVRVADGSGLSSTTVMVHVLGSAAAGDVRYYQLWYRDAPNFGACTGGFNLSNAVQLTWTP